MKPFLILICGFMAAWLLQVSTGIVFLYAPAIIFPLILIYKSRMQRIAYFIISITCYTLIVISLTLLKLNFPAVTILFFLSAAFMYLVFGLLNGLEEYKAGVKAIFFFTAWYAMLVFIAGMVFKHDFIEGHITYILVPAWYYVVGKRINILTLHPYDNTGAIS